MVRCDNDSSDASISPISRKIAAICLVVMLVITILAVATAEAETSDDVETQQLDFRTKTLADKSINILNSHKTEGSADSTYELSDQGVLKLTFNGFDLQSSAVDGIFVAPNTTIVVNGTNTITVEGSFPTRVVALANVFSGSIIIQGNSNLNGILNINVKNNYATGHAYGISCGNLSVSNYAVVNIQSSDVGIRVSDMSTSSASSLNVVAQASAVSADAAVRLGYGSVDLKAEGDASHAIECPLVTFDECKLYGSSSITEKPTEEYESKKLITYRWIVGELYGSSIVKFNANGGEGTMKEYHVNPGTVFVLPQCEFTKKDCTFRCWKVNGEEKLPGDKLSVTSDGATITAEWEGGSAEDNTALIWTIIAIIVLIVAASVAVYLYRRKKINAGSSIYGSNDDSGGDDERI